jgi:hypothetical protein
MYEHMTQYLPSGKAWMREVRRTIAGENHCQFKGFWYTIDATRMSGEMNTSLGNGFTNLMALLFLFRNRDDVQMVIEGDDSLVSFIGDHPVERDFESVGLTIKISVRDRLNQTGFCQLMFDEEDRINVSDPVEALVSFAWTSRAYVGARKSRLSALLRSKSLSYLHQYPGCPVIQSLALYGLRITKDVDIAGFIENERSLSMWERQQLRDAESALRKYSAQQAFMKQVPLNTRLLVQERFGMTIETQIAIERYLDSKTDLSPLDGPISDLRFPVSWTTAYSRYVSLVDLKHDDVDAPYFSRGDIWVS